MIVQIDEKFHDHELRTFYVETDRLKPTTNPVDALVIQACNKKAFNQIVHIDVDKKREEDESLWDDPGLSGGANVRLKDGDRPEKVIKLTLYFDC